MRYLWKWFLARFRLSHAAICELSASLGTHDDYHDYDVAFRSTNLETTTAL